MLGLILRVAVASLAGLIIEGVRTWTALKPFKRWRVRRAMKSWRVEHPDEILEEFHDQSEESEVSEQAKSFLRSLAKILGGALAAKGVIDAGQVDVVIVAAESIIGGALALIAVWQSHKKHA